MTSTVVPDLADRPAALPSERLQANGMAIPALRADLRRIDNARNARLGGGRLVLGRPHHRRRRVDRPVVGLRDRLRADGTDVRPLRHLDARGGAQAPLHQQTVERPDRQVGGRLPGLHAGAALPAGPLRASQGRVRAGRAGHGVLLPLSVHAPRPAPPSLPRRGRHQRVEELRAAGQEHAAQALPPHRPLDLRHPGRPLGDPVDRHRPLVDLPAAVVPALDDGVACHQPPPLDRRARWHGAQRRSTRHDAQRAADLAGAVLDRAVQHRLASRPPRRHGRAVAQPARVPRRARAGGLHHRGITYPSYRALWRALRRPTRRARSRRRPSPPEHAATA